MQIRSMTLKNIGKFEFKQIGFNSGESLYLSFPSGRGKTTILASMVFALSGTLPYNLQAQMFKKNDVDDPGYVELDTYDGWAIRRTTARGQCALRATLEDEWKNVTVTELNLFIQNTTGLPNLKVLNCLMVPHALADSSPAEARTYIEQLIGLDLYHQKLSDANKKLTEAKAEINVAENQLNTVARELAQVGNQPPVENELTAEEWSKANFKFTQRLQSATNKLNNLVAQINAANQELAVARSVTGVCPTCKRDYEVEDTTYQLINTLQENILKLQDEKATADVEFRTAQIDKIAHDGKAPKSQINVAALHLRHQELIEAQAKAQEKLAKAQLEKNALLQEQESLIESFVDRLNLLLKDNMIELNRDTAADTTVRIFRLVSKQSLVPWSNLSTGERLKAGIDLVLALQELRGITLPIVIDEAQSSSLVNWSELVAGGVRQCLIAFTTRTP